MPVLPDGVDILLDKDACIAWGKGVCTRCEDACSDHALFFVGLMNPRVLRDRCTLCADCVEVCPTGALRVRAVVNAPAPSEVSSPATGDSP